MLDMRKTFGKLGARGRQWEKLMPAGSLTGQAGSADGSAASHLREITDFGSNPGALRMFTHMPPQASAGCGLVVVLHGCMQTAAAYDHGAGWSTLADRYGFALLLPEQQRANNPNGCFNWFQPGDIERDDGEALSIRQMVEKMVLDHGVDRSRVFVTGLSAGGAMASVMLATYPDVFAGGAIVAGLPYGAAHNMQQAFQIMFQGHPRSARAWGERVRDASPHRGPWPRVSVWQGGADTTVVPSNAAEIVKQWTNVHGLPADPTLVDTVDGYPRQVWRNAAGEDVIESYTITGMAHGTPLAVGDADDQCGATGAFLLEAGISSSYHIAKFWGLADPARASARPAKRPAVSPSPPLQVLDGGRKPKEPVADAAPAHGSHLLPVDIKSVITQALKAAGLMKTN